MSAVSVPLSLFHTGRAQCPDCGAALPLVDHAPLIVCKFCGGTAAVERRLRTLEPVIAEGFITADAPLDTAREVNPSQTLASVAQDESHCPTCGVELDASTATQAIRRCAYCGTQSKIERRLLRSPAASEALNALEAKAAPHELRQFAATEALIEKVEADGDFAQRVKAAHELGEYWSHVNVRAARLLPRVLQVLVNCDPRLEMPLAELVGKLLCSDNIVLANAVLRAAEKFTFDVNGSMALLRQLSLGSGIGLKLLLDTADFAATRGAMEYACCALWSVNTMIERNYADRMRLADVVLYRLLYLRGPVQAWAIELAKGQMGLGCRFPTPTLLQFIDDCAAERPELVPHISQCFYDGGAKSGADFIARLDFMNTLYTWPAKVAALENLYPPPPEASNDDVDACLQKLLALTLDPHLGRAAINVVVRLIDDDPTPRPCVEAMVRAHGEKLPEEIRRVYLRKCPNTPLLKPIPLRNRPFEKSPPLTAFDEQLAAWTKLWNSSIRQAVDRYQERQRMAWAYLNEINT